jgi:hypothetical protein
MRRKLVMISFGFAALCLALVANLQVWSQTESGALIERILPYSVDVVKRGLSQVGFDGGRLPMVDGFVGASIPQLDRYQRPYYQYRLQVNAIDANTTSIKVEARISAWYADPEPSHSQYRSLPSNGRLEADLLDRLLDALGSRPAKTEAVAPAAKAPAAALPASELSSPGPVAPQSVKPSLPAVKLANSSPTPQEQLDALLAERQAVRGQTAATLAQIEQLKAADRKSDEVAKLASIKHSGVGVMSRKNFGGPVLFRAQAEDEFEVQSLESGWALVRLSDNATGYIQADELNLPPGIVEKPSVAEEATPAAQPAKTSEPDLGFWVSREDVNVFSGDWARLKGKRVLFVYAQPRGLLSNLAGDDTKLAYAKRVFVTRFHSVAQSSSNVEGVVVVFLGNKGGVAAATLLDIRQWVEGGLGDEAFVNRCSLDPPAEFRRIHLN